MKCPICYYKDTKVIDSRVASDGLLVRRRRECLKCSFRFSTYEEIEILDLTVIKSNGDRENYNREKIILGLKKALHKRNTTNEIFKKLIHSIERDIQKIRKKEIYSSDIGSVIMKNLKKVDNVAYIRFASVYKDFKTADDFKKLITKKK